MDVDLPIALSDFREHYAAQPGCPHTPADWTRRFAKWVRENLQRQAAQPAPPEVGMQTAANVLQRIISPQQRRVNVTDAPASGLQGGELTAGPSSIARDGQWRFAEQRMKEIGPNRCDGLHYVHQPLRLVLGRMARDGELQA